MVKNTIFGSPLTYLPHFSSALGVDVVADRVFALQLPNAQVVPTIFVDLL